MNKEEVHSLAQQIKRSFRLYMNGETSHSMREKGAGYAINWGIELHRLRAMAAEYEPNLDLARELWQSQVRECKIMATLLIPKADISRPLAEEMAATLLTVEMAEVCTMNVFQYVPQAEAMALEWITVSDTLLRISGFHLLSRLLARGYVPDAEQARQIGEAADAALAAGQFALSRAAHNCALRLEEVRDEQNLDIL